MGSITGDCWTSVAVAGGHWVASRDLQLPLRRKWKFGEASYKVDLLTHRYRDNLRRRYQIGKKVYATCEAHCFGPGRHLRSIVCACVGRGGRTRPGAG